MIIIIPYVKDTTVDPRPNNCLVKTMAKLNQTKPQEIHNLKLRNGKPREKQFRVTLFSGT